MFGELEAEALEAFELRADDSLEEMIAVPCTWRSCGTNDGIKMYMFKQALD